MNRTELIDHVLATLRANMESMPFEVIFEDGITPVKRADSKYGDVIQDWKIGQIVNGKLACTRTITLKFHGGARDKSVVQSVVAPLDLPETEHRLGERWTPKGR